ncbi:MAG: hypothetical protein AAB115_07470 [Pseudomonadota bacterium]
MSNALSTAHSAFGGARMRGLNLRAIDQLGIKRLVTDSRCVKRGDTFVAYPGESQDGRGYIARAVAGAANAVTEAAP